jgi:Uma2 family endonuclease
MTARRFLALGVPEGGRPWNLVDGEVVLSEPTPLHQEVQGNLLFALESWARATPQRGRVSLPRDVTLDESNVFAPDILWYREGRVPDVHAAPPSPMPDLAVEIRSASNWRYDPGAKKPGYERLGLPELWLVDTSRRTVLVYRRSGPDGAVYDPAEELGGSDELTSPQPAGFAVRVDLLLFP